LSWTVKILRAIAIFLALTVTMFYIGSFLITPFSEWDTAFYPLIGKGVLKYHILPYGYIFDHKPFLACIFYYIWCQVEPFMNGRFTILAFISMASICLMLSRFYKINLYYTAFYLFLGGILGNYISGNTETLQIPVIVAVIIFMTKAIEEKKNYYFLLSGILTAVSININYLAGCILGPLFLYALFSRLCTFPQFMTGIGGGILGLAIIFMPFLISGNGKLSAYFAMQYHFLQHYGADPKERLDTIITVGAKIAFLSPILFLWFGDKKVFWDNLRTRMLTLWFLCSVVASIMSGHGYTHYAALFLIPAMVMCTILHQNGRLSSFWPIAPLCVYSLIFMIVTTIHNVNNMRQTERANAPLVSTIVGNQKVLNIRSDQSLYYLADLEPFDPFLFRYHIDIYFDKQATKHYMEDLKQRPPFVLMQYRACTSAESADEICMWMKEHYHLVYKAYDSQTPFKATERDYELYKLND
jgi:hypothetical protein